MAHLVLPCFRRIAPWGQQEVERARNCWQATTTTTSKQATVSKIATTASSLDKSHWIFTKKKENSTSPDLKRSSHHSLCENSSKSNTILQKKNANLTLNEGKRTLELVWCQTQLSPLTSQDHVTGGEEWESASLKMSSGPIFTEQIDQLVLKLVSPESESEW